jgi:3-oxoacyl-[acyl-carrier-protein] synthase-3
MAGSIDSDTLLDSGGSLSLGGVTLRVPSVPSLRRDPVKLNGHRLRLSAQIIGWGRYAPASVITNDQLARMVDTTDQWIRERTGIVERHAVGPKECTSVMGLHAARHALAVADLTPSQVDAVVVATSTPDQPVPSTASVIQDALGADNAAAFDVNAGCTGFVYALVVANGLIAAGIHSTVLVVGADTLTRFTDWADRGTCVLFGDGAGAVVLQATEGSTGMLAATLGSDGFGGNLLTVVAGGSRVPASHETVEKRMHYIRMNGREVFKFAVNKMVKATTQVVADAGLTLDDVALIIPHQANLRIVQAAAKGLKLPEDRFFVNIDRYGNTSSATVPMALAEAVEAGRIKQGDYVVLVAFGAGLTWGAVLIQWGAPGTTYEPSRWKSVSEAVDSRRRQLKGIARLAKRKLDPTTWWN